jgi:exopolysaccharide biosynthesis polyprenyl glycosylphosphotransferase
MVAIAFALALFAFRRQGWGEGDLAAYALMTALSLPCWLAMFERQGLYRARYVSQRIDEFRRVVAASATALLATMAIGFAIDTPASKGWLVFGSIVAVVLVMAAREAVRLQFERRRLRGEISRRVVIVGTSGEGLDLAEMLEAEPRLGYEVVGFVDEVRDGRPRSLGRWPILGTVASTGAILRRCRADGVIVATSEVSLDTVNTLARDLSDAGIHVELSSMLRDISIQRLSLRVLGRAPVVYVERVRLHGWRAIAKRSFDLAVAAAGLFLTAPLLLAIAIAIKLDSRGPVLFCQERVGRNGVDFGLFKFRTMIDGADRIESLLRHRNDADGPLFKVQDDPRVTRVGRVLRQLSLDELPQLWNVVRGEMSLVGPRPALRREMAGWSRQLHNRLRVRPGITGMWQVHGRSDSSFDDYSRLDLYYVDNWSLSADLAILLRTVPAVFARRGAY